MSTKGQGRTSGQPCGGYAALTALTALFTLVVALLPIIAATPPALAQTNKIVDENILPGNPSSEWDISGAGDPSLQGFATDISVDQGGVVEFKVGDPAGGSERDPAAPPDFHIDIYRLGYYAGDGARLVATIDAADTTESDPPACAEDAATGLVDCGSWPVAATWTVPSNATSGVYIGRLVREDNGGASHVPFVVRDDDGTSDLLVQTSDTTWHAYNQYGGNSLYTGSGPGTGGGADGRAYAVSYNRPITTRATSSEDALFNAEYPMIRWLERNGYDVSYSTGIDTERSGTELLEHQVFVSVGHDEYWSGPQVANVEAARDAGVDLAFFSGNEVFWRTRLSDSIDSSATPNRTLISYKETHDYPNNPDPSAEWTGTWRDPRDADSVNLPENGLTGTIFTVNCCTYDMTVPAEDGNLRFWRDTSVSLSTGADTLGSGIVGYEWDEDLDNGFRPAGQIQMSSTTVSTGEKVIESSYGSSFGPGVATHSLTLHRAASGALVFGAGTVQWSWGLDAEHDRGSDPEITAVQQATVNLFADMGVQPSTLQTELVAATASTDTTAPTSSITNPTDGGTIQAGTLVSVTGTASDADGAVAGIEVSVDGGTSWHPAQGRDSWSYSFTAPATEGATVEILSRATDDSVNTETPGTPITVTTEPRTCPCSVFGDVVPTPDAPSTDTDSVELGLKFQTTESGFISGIRFYKYAGNTGTHYGRLWDASGAKLAQVTFTGETASGWQEASFDAPVAVDADTTYVISYLAPAGAYAETESAFASSGIENPPLRAVAEGEDGSNGVYKYSNSNGSVCADTVAGCFPTDTFNSSNYWVDAVFIPTLPEYSLWDDSTLPSVEAFADPTAVEVGVTFRADVPGDILGIRFYTGATNTGPYSAHLWSADQTQLAAADFTAAPTVGWQELRFDTPFEIAADTPYVASYHTATGNYAADLGYFDGSGFASAPLYAYANTEDGQGNGLYTYGTSSAFPSNATSANYWVDVIFRPAALVDDVAPEVVGTTPSDGAVGVPATVAPAATFSERLDGATVTGSTVTLSGPGGLVAATVGYDDVARRVTLTPDAALDPTTAYTATVVGGASGIADLAGNELVTDVSWSFTTAAPPTPFPDDGPGGPILVIADAGAGNPFGRYLGDILLAEGLNEYLITDIASVDASTLSGYDVVVLSEVSLAASEVTMLTDWVDAGGNLIAMRPDAQLAGLLGLTASAGTLDEGYLLMDTGSAPGAGLVDETIQFHGTADYYTLSGASELATLYSDAGTATAYPAVTVNNVGTNGGQAAAFTYDLARSVVYTRQGNPAWVDSNGDGSSGPVRSDDLFHNGTDPDWVDLDKVAIPQADEQQRLLANLITTMNLDQLPLPRLWYLPRGAEAAVLLTSDDHSSSNISTRLDHYKDLSPVGCSVDDWECVRASMYIYAGTTLTESQANTYTADGFEIGVHVDTSCLNYTLTELQSMYSTQLGDFATRFPALPVQASERTHCIAWSGWAMQPTVKAENGIRLDTNYYYWPDAWLANRPGMFTGSGLPMRFADLDGSIFDVYQATTQMTDESGQTYPFTINALLDKAVGPEGFYGVFTANMHSDSAASPGADAIIASAQTRGVPVVSGRQMTEWLDGRNTSSFDSLTWDGTTLGFSVTIGAGANGLQAMVPANSATGSLVDITLDGSPVTHALEIIKGIEYATFVAAPGSYTATYGADTTAPTVTATSPADAAVDVAVDATATAKFSEPIDAATVDDTSFTLEGPGGPVAATVTYDAGTSTAILTPAAALDFDTNYDATVSGVADPAGNAMTVPETWSFTTIAAPTCPCTIFNDTFAGSDFNDGQSIETGVRFRSSEDGLITAIRFYKNVAAGTDFTGTLWTNTGTSLGTGAVTLPAGATGWQEIPLTTPVPITAGVTYVASHYSALGNYTATVPGLATGVDNPPLRALADGEDGANGVYLYGGGFPTSTFNSGNYWVDVVFTTDTTAPAVTLTSPLDGATDVSPGTAVTATFNEPVDAATVDDISFTLEGPGGSVAATVTYDAGTSTATLTPAATLDFDTNYDATVSGVADPAGNVMAADEEWSFTTSSDTCPCSIWDDTATPVSSGVNDGQPIEVGTKFRADRAGYITSLRFYKGAGDTDTHVGHLWTADGTQLAEVTFTDETASGWQEMMLPTPVAIDADTTYVASVFSAPLGNLSITLNGLINAVDNPPLRALAAGDDGPNGVFVYGGGFPTGGSDHNYWVDVVFASPDTTAPTIVDRVPAPDETDVARSVDVIVTFSEAMDVGSLTPSTFRLRADGAASDIDATVSTTGAVATLTPSAPLEPGTLYTVTLDAAIADLFGNSLESEDTWSFTTTTTESLVDSTFSGGTGACTIDPTIGDGALRLPATIDESFDGTSLPSGWAAKATPWTAGGTATVGGGVLAVEGTMAGTTDTFGPGHSLEFVATFTTQSFQHVGFVADLDFNNPWVIVSTGSSGNGVYARSNSSSDESLGTGLLGTPHRYRIDWTASGFDFFVDDSYATTIPFATSGPMLVGASASQLGSPLTVDWIQMTPYVSPCTFTSAVLDAGSTVDWLELTWTGDGTEVAFESRTGATATPDGTWSEWAATDPTIPGPNAQYAQYRVTLSTPDPAVTPTVESVTLTYQGVVNTAPVAVDDAAATLEDSPQTVPAPGVLENDTDDDGDDLIAALVDNPTHGTVTLNEDGSYTYVPDADYFGTDTFTYTANDGIADSNAATVTITVNPVNDAPNAADDAYATPEDTPLTVPTPGVLGNDDDVEGNALSATLLTSTASGALTLNADGSFDYTPNTDFAGSDSFTYDACDDGTPQECASATVTVAVVPGDDAPVANDDSATTDEDTAVTINVAANDTDADGNLDPASATVTTDPTNGAVVDNDDGTFTYTPAADFNGTDTFTYEICDATDLCASATVTITVVPVNDSPDAEDDSVTTAEDTPVTIDVAANDTDPDNDALAVDSVTNPSNGTAEIETDNTVTYTPNADFNGTDSFDYTITDGNGGTDTATVTITIDPVNDAPVANDDSATTDEDTPVTIGVAANDTDPDNDALAVDSVTNPSNGTAEIEANNTVTYTPNADFNGTDSFDYTITDGNGGTDTATVTITIDPVNDAPVANDDSATTDEDTPVTIGVAANDTDAEGDLDPATTTVETGPSNGTVTNNGDGTIEYTPDADFNGDDTFTYEICDLGGACDSADVTVAVLPVNDAPVANDDFTTTNEDTAVTIDVAANDTDADGNLDPATTTVETGPSNGTVTNNSDGTIEYTPNADFNGDDTFTYEICDATALCDTATVAVTVDPVNDAPVANDDSATTNEDTAVTIDVAANDTDADGNLDPTTVSITQDPASGTVAIDGAGTAVYTPDTDFNGDDTFTYEICDLGGACDSADVTVAVLPVNDAPVANDDATTTNEEVPVTVDVAANDTDADGNLDPTSATVTTDPTNGAVVDNDDGTFTYTPDPDFNGTDTFTYEICDTDAACDTADVTITVAGLNDAPEPEDDEYTTDEDVVLTIAAAEGVLANDSDVEGDTLTAALDSDVTNGVLTLNADGAFEYIPNGDLNGTDSFTYTVSDGNGGSATATVSLTVDPVNDIPVAADDSYSTPEDTILTVPAPGILSNDEDVDGDVLVASTLTSATNGTLTLNADGSFTYTPSADFSGTDGFTYEVCDPDGACDTGAVVVTVDPVNDAPVAEDVTATTDEDTPVDVPVLESTGDIDGDVLTIASVAQAGHGTVTIDDGGTPTDPTDDVVTYTPDANYVGQDSFTYTVSDGNGGTATGTVSVTVDPVNDAPVANDDSGSTDEDTAVTIPVLGNDSDVDGDTLSIESVTDPDNGSVVDNGDGTVTYTPNPDYSGTDDFAYTVSDGNGGTATATVTVTVNSVNDAPNTVNDPATTDEDTPVTVDVLDNDLDPDGDTLSVTSVTQPGNGTATDNGDGTVTYTPNNNYNGPDTFTYTVSDGNGGSATGTVSVTVTPVNDDPVANDDSGSTEQGFAVNVDVLGNDTDVDGDTLSVDSVTQPTNGTVVIETDDTVTYTPELGFVGDDSFTYTVSDGNGGTATATVTIHVNDNDAPAAVDDEATTDEDTAVTIDVLGNDSDPDNDLLVVDSVNQPANGTATDNGDGTVTYTPNPDFNGTDTFTYDVCDDGVPQNCSTATVSVTVDPVNDAPVANDDSGSTDEDTAVTIPVLGNDSDVDGDTLSIESVTDPDNGSVVDNGDGTVTYTPNPDYSGTDDFAYTVSDGNGGTATATVTVTVNSVNDAPNTVNDPATTDEDTPVTVDVLDNDLDPDGDTLSVTSVTQPGNGTATDNGDGTVTYTPNNNYNGTDTFTYTACDPEGQCDTAEVTVTVSSVNDQPVANDDTASTDEDTAVDIAVLDNDSDVDGDTLTIDSVTQPANGNVVDNGDGTVTYTPTVNYNGADTFTYVVSDGNGGTATATVTVTVNSVNGPPDAVDDTATTDEATPVAIPVLDNDTDPNGDALSVASVTQPGNGIVTIETDGTVTYTPDANYNGTDTFTYDVCDPDGLCDTATVTVTVEDVVSSIAVTKTADPDEIAEPGGAITFTISVENTSTVDDVTIESITDSMLGGDISAFCDGAVPATLMAGESITCTVSGSVSGVADDVVTNTVEVTGTDDDGAAVFGEAQATVTITAVAGPMCNGLEATIVGSGLIWGTTGDDVILGSAAGDLIYGRGGNDTICAGAGGDTVYPGRGNDTIFGEGGVDWIFAGSGNDTVGGGAGNDLLTGSRGADTISGNAGADSIYGDRGPDVLSGGSGSDVIYGGNGNDAIAGDAGDDDLYGNRGNDAIDGGAGNDYANGGSGNADSCVNVETSVRCEL